MFYHCVYHCNHVVGNKRDGGFALVWFLSCVLSVAVYLLLVLVSVIGYVL